MDQRPVNPNLQPSAVSSPQPSSEPWADFRRQMPSADRWACFDHAAVAPISAPARDALVAWSNDMAAGGATNSRHWGERLEQTRRLGAELLGADPAEVALIRNTTEGINLVAEGFPWRPGDNVVVPADEFPSNLYPWMNLAGRGIEARRVPVERGRPGLDALAAACDEHTRVIAASWVGYASGWRSDIDALAELAHRRGAYLFLDVIQGLGVFPLDVRRTPVDFLAADGHKWLLGPEGAGLFYVRREHLDLLRPIGVGWNSVVHWHDFSHVELKLKPTAGRYEGGTYNVGGLAALGGSLELLACYGQPALAERVLSLTSELCRRLEQSGAEVVSCRDEPHASGIVAFDWPGRNPLAVRKHCRDRQVLLSCRGGWLRASPHAYNNEEDIDRLISALTSA